MAGVCGWLNNPTATAAVLTAMTHGLAGNAQAEQHFLSTQTACAVRGGTLADSAGLLTALCGSVRWHSAELQQVASAQGDAVALATAYRRYDIELFTQLHGVFTLVILDTTRQRALLAIDRIGQHTLYYAPVETGLVFGSSAGCLYHHPNLDKHLATQGIFNYLYCHMLPSPGSIYQAQAKLPGGHYLEWQAGQLHTAAYWLPTFTEQTHRSLTDLSAELHTLIQQAVQRHITPSSGAFLSGGLDSSTVAGMLAQQLPNARSYSIGFNAEGYDEIPYARLTAQHFALKAHEYYVTPEDVLALIPEIARSYDEPFGNSSALPVYCCARLARQDGITRLFAGDGGDELFGGNERYAKQQLFEHYQRVPTPLRHTLEPILSGLQQLPLVRKAHSYVRQANIPLPDRLETYNFLHRHHPSELFTSDFLASIEIGQPLALLRSHYAAPEHATTLNRMLYLDWQRTLHDNDLVKVNRMCQLAGVDVVYPLLDDELVAFSCALPSHYKVRHGQLRWFYKQAMRDFLPQGTLRKSKHGFGLPFGVWTRTHPGLRALAYDSIHTLRAYGWFRPDFLDMLANLHDQVHAAYYGELVWLLMMLAQWLAAQSTR